MFVEDHPMNIHKVLYKVSVFLCRLKIQDAATAGHRLTLDPMGKYSNAFFSETTNMIKARLSLGVYIGWSSTNFTFFVPI
jgi:hypothetical protein